MKNITLRQLKIFGVAASELSFTRAADALCLTQPAVSMQIKLLEEEIGLKLFIKRGKKLFLSEAGSELLRHTRSVLAHLEVASESLAALHVGHSGRLHLGVVSTANYFAPALLAAFRSLHPGVRVKLTVDRREAILALLKDHKIDLAITGHPPNEAEVEAEIFARHPHYIVAAADHPLAQQRHLHWSALQGESFIFREQGSATRNLLEYLLQQASMSVEIAFQLLGNETVKQAVIAGLGISLLSAHSFQIEFVAGHLAILDLTGMPMMMDWYLLHSREKQPCGVHAAFRRFLLDEGALRIQACSAPGMAWERFESPSFSTRHDAGKKTLPHMIDM